MGESLCPIRCDAQRSPPVCAAQSLAVLSARSMSTREVFYAVLYRASLLGGLSLPASEVEVHARVLRGQAPTRRGPRPHPTTPARRTVHKWRGAIQVGHAVQRRQVT
jgi:hypothetical protein